jgi:transcriptional regulator with XRE-family HTH domain
MTTASDGRVGGVVPVIETHHRLQIARQHMGINQSELAQRLGVTTSTVQRAESGHTKPRRTTLMAWSMATGVDLHWLETGNAPHSEGPDGGQLLPHLDSNQKPAGLLPWVSDQDVCDNIRYLPTLLSSRQQREASLTHVRLVTRRAA